MMLQACACELHRVTVFAAGGDYRAAGNRVPGCLGPLNLGVVAHFLIPKCCFNVRWSKPNCLATTKSVSFFRANRIEILAGGNALCCRFSVALARASAALLTWRCSPRQ